MDRTSLQASTDQARQLMQRITEHPANAEHPWRAVGRSCWWQVRKRAGRRPIDIDYEGFRLRCYADSGSASNVWYFTARYDHPEMTFLDRYLRPGDHALDVGANIGTYSLFIAARVGPTGRIDAVEAEPTTAERLRHTIGRNDLAGLVHLHPVAVDAQQGTVRFFVDRDVANGIATEDDPRGLAIEVPARALDSLVAPDRRLAVAKLDVEGVEVQALEGATALLSHQRPPVWIVEVIATQLRWFGTTADDLYDLYEAAGYEPYCYDVTTNQLIHQPDPVKGNVLFVATDQLGMIRDRLEASPSTPTG
jgi:FkbM family methyltransferase